MERKIVSGIMLTLLFVSFLTGIYRAEAEDTSRIYVYPPVSYAAPGYTFSVNVVLEGVTDLYGWEFKFFWNNSILECITDVVHLPLGCNWEDPNHIKLGPGIKNDYNETHGRYFRGLSAMPAQEPFPTPFDGTALLVTLAFKVKAEGICTLDLQDIKLSDSGAKPIPHTAEDGYFESGPPGTMIYVDPLVSYAAPGYTFSIDIVLGGVTDLCGWEFKLFWDNSLLECITEEIHYPPDCHWGDPNNIEAGLGIENDYNATHGRYFRGLSRQSVVEPYPASFNGTTRLVTLTFNLTYMRACILSLYETKLENSESEPIPHSVVDGYVKAFTPVAPKASFTYSPTAPFVNQTVTFDASDSTPTVGEIVNYTWNFGDGFTIAETHPITSHLYTAEGTYLVTLNVTDTIGLSGTASELIKILGPCGPRAKFTYSPNAPLINDTVTFNASVSELGWNGTHYVPIVTYEWNFGDGTPTLIESDPVVTHVFVNRGSYNVTLNVTDIRGWWNSTSSLTYIFRFIPPSATTAVLVEPPYYYGEVLGETFTVEIIALNLDDVAGFEFKLDYDTAILDAIDIALGPFLKEPTYVPKKEINDAIGMIWFAAASFGYTAYGSGVLAMITFEVTGLGLCIFNLYGLKISTPWAEDTQAPPVITPTIHNVAIVSVAPSATQVYAGHTVNITVVVKNSGNAVESFNVTVYYDTSIIGIETVANLTAGAEVTLTFSWNTLGVEPCHNYTIKAEVSLVPEEISTADNLYNYGTVKVKIMGDVNGDDATDIIDVVKAGLALGSYPGHRRWDPNADLKNDGIVDIFDLVLIAKNFGKKA